jgi:Trk K+ transport system NAD-binding subunit
MPGVENKTLAEADLADRRVRVLWIRRGGVEIGNPHGTTRILPGDTLLCYGPRGALRAILRTRPGTSTPSTTQAG